MADKSKPEVYTGERCFIRELLNEAGCPEVSVARCRVEPGVTTELHRLDVLEWYVIEQGSGRVMVGDGPDWDVGPGDVVSIPAGTPQCIANIGGADLVFLCICAPRFQSDDYTALECPKQP